MQGINVLNYPFSREFVGLPLLVSGSPPLLTPLQEYKNKGIKLKGNSLPPFLLLLNIHSTVQHVFTIITIAKLYIFKISQKFYEK